MSTIEDITFTLSSLFRSSHSIQNVWHSAFSMGYPEPKVKNSNKDILLRYLSLLITMNKLLVSVVVILVCLFAVGLYLLSEVSGKNAFEKRFASASKLTFSVGKGSVLKQELKVALTYVNRSVEVQEANRTMRVDGFSWPFYHLCPVEGQAQCYDVPFSLLAMPKELLGVDSIALPFELGYSNKILLNYVGVTDLDMPWGHHAVMKYTNFTAGYPQPNVNMTTNFYFDAADGYLVKIEVSMTDGNLTSTAIFQLMDLPQLSSPLETSKPAKWEWGG